MQFGESFGPETISKEYKDFSFTHIHVPYKENELERLILSSEWYFDELVEKAISRYVELYMPKYVASFLNPKTNLDKASFYVGIDDNGIVSGIPYMGDVTELDKVVKKAIDPMIAPCLSVEWIKVSYKIDKNDKSDIHQNIHPKLLAYYEKKRKMIETVHARKLAYDQWMETFKRYSQKLVEIYNDPLCRPLFIQYVKHQSPIVYEQIMNGFEMKQQPYQTIQDFRKSKDNVYYWICQWKDEILRVLQKTKPKPISRNYIHSEMCYGPLRIFSKAKEMIPYWVKKNQSLSLYVLKISIHKDNQSPMNFEYKSTTYVRSLTKSVRNGKVVMEPCCIPIHVKIERDSKKARTKNKEVVYD
jgi:hypothetical protein